MRILISPVGMQDPFSADSGEEGSAVTLWRELKPDFVYLIPTATRLDTKSSTEQAASDTKEWLVGEGMADDRVLIKPLDVADPTDYGQVLPAFHAIATAILEETAGDAARELFLNASSATPQIKTAGLILVASRALPARPLQVADPRFQTRADRVQEIAVAFLIEGPTVDKVRRLFERHLFAVCQEELGRLAEESLLPHRRYIAGALTEVCVAYAALDRLAYAQVVPPLQRALKALRGIRQLGGVQAALEAQAKAAAGLAATGDVERFDVLGDIFDNAVRRYDEENHVDVLARAWRIAEGCLFSRLREAYQIEPHDLARSTNQPLVKKIREAGITGRYLMMQTARQVLDDLCHDERFVRLLRKSVPPELGRFGGFVELFDRLRDLRNHSVVAHGVQPVTPETARQALHLAEMMLAFAFPAGRLSELPFSKANLRLVGDSAFAALAS